LSQTTKDQTTKDAAFAKLKSEYTFVLAIVIVVAYIVFFGIIINQSPDGGKTGTYEGLKTITATFGLIVATVVGYYFGQRPAEAAQQRAEQATSEASKAQQRAEQANSKAEEINKNTQVEIPPGIDAYSTLRDYAKGMSELHSEAKDQLTAEERNRLVEKSKIMEDLCNERIKNLKQLQSKTITL
jgi:preprotein translocase subunit YajC